MYPKAYIDFLVYFHGTRDYFECHEVLEEYWKQQKSEEKNSIWVGLILIAVALYHHRAGNNRGAARTLNKAIHNIEENKKKVVNTLGLDHDKLLVLLKERLSEINNGLAYYSINMPILDNKLLKACIDRCKSLGLNWNKQSDMSNRYLIYKHSLRDRSDVIKEREAQLNVRKNKRPDS